MRRSRPSGPGSPAPLGLPAAETGPPAPPGPPAAETGPPAPASAVRTTTAFTAVVAMMLLAVSCSLDYDEIAVTEERDEDVPETVITDAEFTVVRGNGRSFHVTAERAETYPERERQILYELSFEELDSDGRVVTRGTAGRAEHNTADDDVTMSEGISFYSEEYEARVTTEYLAWDNEREVLSGSDDGEVRLELDSGSVLEGTGFEADMRRSIAELASSVRGVVETDEE